MKVLGIDVGRKWAWSFYDEVGFESEKYETNIIGFGNTVKKILDLYKPEVVVTARPTHFHTVIASQSKLLGILEYFCNKRGIEYIEYIDSHCKKVVLGRGRAGKEEIMQAMGCVSADIADSRMFVKTYLKETC